MGRRWDTPEARRALMSELVSWDSRGFHKHHFFPQTLNDGSKVVIFPLKNVNFPLQHFGFIHNSHLPLISVSPPPIRAGSVHKLPRQKSI